MVVKTTTRPPERAAAAQKAEPVKASVRHGSGVRLTFIASTIPPPASGYEEEGERSSSAAAPVNNSPRRGECGASRDVGARSHLSDTTRDDGVEMSGIVKTIGSVECLTVTTFLRQIELNLSLNLS